MVVLSSASHLAWVGPAAYASEFVSAKRRLRAAFKNGIEVLHGLPLLLGGVEDSKGIFSFLDFFEWINLDTDKRDIIDTRKLVVNELKRQIQSGEYEVGTLLAPVSQEGTPLAPKLTACTPLAPPENAVSPSATVKYHLRLPKDCDSRDFASFEAVREIFPDMFIEKMDPETITEMVSKLAMELNVKFMTDLRTAGGFEAGNESEDSYSCSSVRLIIIGGSHAGRLAQAAEGLGIDHVNLAMPGFRVREDTIDTACTILRETLEEGTQRDVIVYQLLDNNVFFEARCDGSRSLPDRDPDDNRYHINGKLEYADHGVIKTLVNGITPLLRAGGECEKIILSPLPRYMKRCCKNKEHLTNKRDEDYASKMGEALADIRDSMKDLVYGKKIRSFKVRNTTQLIMGDDTEEAVENLRTFWREDPVHMTQEGYNALLTRVPYWIWLRTRPSSGLQPPGRPRGRAGP
jgi:hypothetical protein